WAVEYLCQFPGAYTEITVSGKGLRILGTSTLESFAPKFKKNGIDVELFSNSNHYLTLSCNEIGHCSELPPIGDEMRAIARRLGTQPDWKDAAPAPDEPAGDDSGTTSGTPWSFNEEARLRSALSAIPTDETVLAEKFGHSHDTWVRIGRAIERLDWSDRGYAIWRDWSAQSSTEFDEKGLLVQWRSFNRNRNARGRPVTIATVFRYAMKCGWSGDQAAEQHDDQAADHDDDVTTAAVAS